MQRAKWASSEAAAADNVAAVWRVLAQDVADGQPPPSIEDVAAAMNCYANMHAFMMADPSELAELMCISAQRAHALSAFWRTRSPASGD